jgi:hypothetical protein
VARELPERFRSIFLYRYNLTNPLLHFEIESANHLSNGLAEKDNLFLR